MKSLCLIGILSLASSAFAATSTDSVYSEVRFSIRNTTNVTAKECLERLQPATNANKFTCRVPLAALPDYAMGLNYNAAKAVMNPDYIYSATRNFNFPLPTGGTQAFKPYLVVVTHPQEIEISFVGPEVIGNSVRFPPMNRAESVAEISNMWTALNLQSATWVSYFFLLRR